jgi:hypothetical protein
LAGKGLFGDPDSIERLVHALLGSNGHGGAAKTVQDVRDQVGQTVGSLVPNEWSGDAANTFAQVLSERDVPHLTLLAAAAREIAAPLGQLGVNLRVANQKVEHAKELATNAGFDIALISSILLGEIDPFVGAVVDAHIVKPIVDEILAARHIAQAAWDEAQHALVNVQVPSISKDDLQQAETWGFSNVPLPRNAQPDPHPISSGLPPTTPRPYFYSEQQRTDAIQLVQQYCDKIVRVAKDYAIPPEAIAGAILWEALENPYKAPGQSTVDPGPGPGKVHKGDADRAERYGKNPLPRSASEAAQRQRLQDKGWAIQYIGKILSDDATIYKEGTARRGKAIDISQNIGVLLTFYEGVAGGPEGAAARDSLVNGPAAANSMAPWVLRNLPWVRAQLTCLD